MRRLRALRFLLGLRPLVGSRRAESLGIFIDGTRSDWWEEESQITAIRRLALRYDGPKEYIGGPGTDVRSATLRMVETLLGYGRQERMRKVAQEIQLWRPKVLHLFGWSRGGDEALFATKVAAALGVPVAFLGLFDPVPARGWGALARVLPLVPLQKLYPRPPVAQVWKIAQVLAGEESSRVLRHARVDPVLDELDSIEFVAGSHRLHVVGEIGEAWMAAKAEGAGVRWLPPTGAFDVLTYPPV